MRISELAERAGIPTSTVRYYERAGLLSAPARTESGYRDYGEEDAARLLFVTRARRMGISCEQITDLLPIWNGVNCTAAHDAITQLVETKRVEIQARIDELERFAEQLDEVRATLESTPPPSACCSDLSCCVPERDGDEKAPVELVHKRDRRPVGHFAGR
jgi:DNA-binding transcriptional MerR regulator